MERVHDVCCLAALGQRDDQRVGPHVARICVDFGGGYHIYPGIDSMPKPLRAERSRIERRTTTGQHHVPVLADSLSQFHDVVSPLDQSFEDGGLVVYLLDREMREVPLMDVCVRRHIAPIDEYLRPVEGGEEASALVIEHQQRVVRDDRHC